MVIGSSVVGPHSCQRAVQTIRSSTFVKGVQHNRETFLKECSSNQVSAGIFCQGTGKKILSLSLPVNNYYPAKVAKAKTWSFVWKYSHFESCHLHQPKRILLTILAWLELTTGRERESVMRVGAFGQSTRAQEHQSAFIRPGHHYTAISTRQCLVALDVSRL